MGKQRSNLRAKTAVTIRMYCHGLGDCFLLTFPPRAPRTKPVRVLVDCGVLQRTPGEREKMRQVAEDIASETNGEIDLLIVTHEHWDHVAGFSYARDTFEGMKFGRVWLSWAEDPSDPDARALKTDIGKTKKKLRSAVAAMHISLTGQMSVESDGEVGADEPGHKNDFFELAGGARALDDLSIAKSLLDFFGPENPASDASTLAASPAQGLDLGGTMEWLRGKVKPGDFCSPGERRAVPGAADVHAYVLGPPRDPASIRKMKPSKGQSYELDRASLLGALEHCEDIDRAHDAPFNASYQVRVKEAVGDPFFREYYGFKDDPLGDIGAVWRRIDYEWLTGASRLALQLDTGVNNTSLALAFELPDGRTLLFPGDAQIGNWTSWEKVEFKTEEGDESVRGPSLVRRAVFYKVGHHGSHNATLRPAPCGLEAMTSGELVAMIPVDSATADRQRPPKDGWQMPWPGLDDRLQEMTGFRVLRADQSEAELNAVAEDAKRASARKWNEFRPRVAFADTLLRKAPGETGERPLYVEYSIPQRVPK